MGIKFRWLDMPDGYSVELNDYEFYKLDRAISNLKVKSGVFVDPYSDTRLSPEHSAALLLDIDGDHVLAKMLRESVSRSKWILVVGD